MLYKGFIGYEVDTKVLHNLCSPLNYITIIKSRVRWEGHAARL
jgi:hypothetical protein